MRLDELLLQITESISRMSTQLFMCKLKMNKNKSRWVETEFEAKRSSAAASVFSAFLSLNKLNIFRLDERKKEREMNTKLQPVQSDPVMNPPYEGSGGCSLCCG